LPSSIRAQDLLEQLAHAVDVAAIQQAVVHPHRGDAALGIRRPRRRVHVGAAVADVGLFGIQLDQVPGRDLEADPLAGLEQVAGSDALGRNAVSAQVRIELLQGRLAVDLEAEKVDAGAGRLADHDAVMVAFVPALEIDAPLPVAAGLQKAQHVLVEIDAFVQVQHADRRMARTQYPGHRH
jgi:hypothetical protein